MSFGQAALGFVTTGGARNFTHYATASTLSFLGKRNVKTVFILDRDERNEEDLEKNCNDKWRGPARLGS
ncbi:hypothetical protein GCM10020254_52390 [Streptomyces goshikiensis]